MRLLKNEQLREQFVQFINEYEAVGHMSQLDVESILSPRYFIPHHCVFKDDSFTTMLTKICVHNRLNYKLNTVAYGT